MLEIKEVSKETDYLAVPKYCKIQMVSLICTIFATPLIGFLMRKIGYLKCLTLQLAALVLLYFLMAGFEGYRELFFLLSLQGFFNNLDLNAQSMINWAPIESINYVSKIMQVVVAILFIVSPFVATSGIKLAGDWAWQFFFIINAGALIFTYFYFRISFWGYKEVDFHNSKPEKNIKIEKAIVSGEDVILKKKSTESKGNSTFSTENFYNENFSEEILQETKLVLPDISFEQKSNFNHRPKFKTQKKNPKTVFSIFFTKNCILLFISTVLLELIQLHPERILIQWLEIKEDNGGLEMSSNSVGNAKSLSSFFSIFFFLIIYPKNNNNKKISSLFKICCIFQTALLAICPFGKILAPELRFWALLLWSILNQTTISIIYSIFFFLLSYSLPASFLGSFYSATRFVSYCVSVFMFLFLGEYFAFVIKDDWIGNRFGDLRTGLFFLPFTLGFLVVLYCGTALKIKELA